MGVASFVSIEPSNVTWQILFSTFSTSGSGGSSADQCDSITISFVLISIAHSAGSDELAPGWRYSTREPRQRARVGCTCVGGSTVTSGKCSLPRLSTDKPSNPG